MTRTFIALEMHEDLQRHLAGVIRQVELQILPSVHWVDPAGIHLTLSFLGELNDAQLEQATQATITAAQQIKPFTYRLTQLGIFGPQRQPRVIWMGIEENSGTLSNLHHILNQELIQRNFQTDTRPFSPHLTLARLKAPLPPNDLQCLQDLLAGKQQNLISSTTYTVKHLNVMKSELLPSGAHYTCLHACPVQRA